MKSISAAIVALAGAVMCTVNGAAPIGVPVLAIGLVVWVWALSREKP